MFGTFFQKITKFFKRKQVKEEIPVKNNVWHEDCLGYEKIAINFTRIIKTFKDQHHIISLEAGSGKTFFLQNWAEELKKQNEIALYYSAWNMNSLEQPLPPLLSFIFDNLFTSKKIKKSIVRKFKNINDQLFSLDTLSKLISKSPLGMFSVFVDVTKEAEKKERSEFTLNELTAYNTRKKNMEDFKAQLTEIIDKIRSGQNIYILVDDLDLCRTKFIIDFLEYIKYTLNIDGLIFILAVDSNVKKAVNSFYGMQNMQRFVDLSFFLPKVSAEKFITRQFESLVLKEIILKKSLINSFIFYAEGFSLSLKDIKRCIYEISLLLLIYSPSNLPNLFPFLIILRSTNNKLYESLSSENALAVLDTEIEPMFTSIINKSKQEWEDLRTALKIASSNTEDLSSQQNFPAQVTTSCFNNIEYIKKMISCILNCK